MTFFFDPTFTSVQEVPVTGCLSNKWGKCKARFPRKTFEQTEVNMDNGALNIKKGEPMLISIHCLITEAENYLHARM